jgi:hypothetical protein
VEKRLVKAGGGEEKRREEGKVIVFMHARMHASLPACQCSDAMFCF